jgi:hypothetical protein
MRFGLDIGPGVFRMPQTLRPSMVHHVMPTGASTEVPRGAPLEVMRARS